MIRLNNSDVRFDKTAHTYELYGHKLQGVTPIVDWMFPSTYTAVPDWVLERAANYGTKIHEACEMFDTLNIKDDHQSVSDYERLCMDNCLQHVASEYLVDDGQNIASSIDKVYFDMRNGEIVLGDIKTTSTLHTERVRLQLSIYAWLFERQNPNLKASRLCAIWLPKPEKHYGTPCIQYVDRIPTEQVQEIVAAYLAGEDNSRFVALFNMPKLADGALPAQLADAERAIVEIETKMKEMKKQSDELKAGLLKLMQENDVKKWSGEHVTLTRKAGGVRITLDSAKVKMEYPDIYAECCKESSYSDSLLVKIA